MAFNQDSGWGRAEPSETGGWGSSIEPPRHSSFPPPSHAGDSGGWGSHPPPPPSHPGPQSLQHPPPMHPPGLPPHAGHHRAGPPISHAPGFAAPPPPSGGPPPAGGPPGPPGAPGSNWVATDSRGDELKTRTLYVTNLPSCTTEPFLVQWFTRASSGSEPRKVTYYGDRGMAFVDFWDIRQSEDARHASQEGIWMDYRHYPEVQVVYGKSREALPRGQFENTGTVYVRPRDKAHPQDPNSKEAYRALFEQYGKIKQITCNRKRESEKFIEYFDLRSASKALALNGYMFNGLIIEVQMSKNQSKNYNAPVGRDNRHRENSYGSAPVPREDPRPSNRPPSAGPAAHVGHHGGNGPSHVEDYFSSRFVDLLFTGKNAQAGRTSPIDLTAMASGNGQNGGAPTRYH